ncbi:mRNP complex [Schizosaccharomyces japonicus yFS275]|uniref:MRNP complex n=1 Tax=Schizosaccharomyces japonicus (strain yFS275 / FY16936) TaxID=402676 RepID=B6JVB7_SCHJY|nr:mRNP complex [Schizosaccharomyces japonicus yFS275]EEB05318.1 mRNP complex [Schizosaccharomyces japonicus yFS275]
MSSHKPVRPDETAHKAAVAELEKKIEAADKVFNAVKQKIEASRGPNPFHEKNKELRAELDKIREAQSAIRSSKQEIIAQLKGKEDALKKKINEINGLKKTVPFKSEADLDKRIERLRSEVESGTMKLVDEKKNLREISQLNHLRKNFGEISNTQSAIDVLKKEAAALREQLDDPESKKLNEQFVAARDSLNALRKKQDEFYTNQRALYAERDAAKAKCDEVYGQRKAMQREYDTAFRAWRDHERQQRAKRQEQIRQEREAREMQRRQATAQKKLEQASIPAFTEEILTCENLIKFLHGTPSEKKEQAASASTSSNLRPRNLAPRAVEPIVGGTVLNKSANDIDDVFSGLKKKTKKASKSNNSSSSDKLNLSLGTLQEFSFVGVEAPLNKSQNEKAVADLKAKIAYFKENQERVTKEKIAKVEKEINDLEAKFEAKKQKDAAKTQKTEETSEPSAESVEKPAEAAPAVVETAA